MGKSRKAHRVPHPPLKDGAKSGLQPHASKAARLDQSNSILIFAASITDFQRFVSAAT
jgi:hypothetical protein